MKKINLIERLWTDSHEKQSPQHFARYAVMLIMLLTLGVGQMWGYTILRCGELYGSGGWSNSDAMTRIGSTNVYYKTYNSPTATTDLFFRIGTGSNWTTEKDNSGIDNLNSNIVMVATTEHDNSIKFQVPTSVPVTIYYNSSTKKIWIKVDSYKTDVLNGKEMFYYGFTNSWSETFAHFYDNGTRKFGNYAANSYADNSAKLAIGVYDVNGSTNYSASNSSSWAGVAHTGMAAGCQIQTYNDNGNKCYYNAASTFSFGTTAYTIVAGTTIASFPSISFTSKTSGVGSSLSLENYYYSTATSGQAWNVFTPGTTESSLAAGTYYIKAIATDGAIYMASTNYITLTVNSAPVLGVANATSVTSNSATFNATATLNSNTTSSYGFKYGAGASYDTKAELISGGTTASTSGALDASTFSKNVTGLSASTTYYYISYAVVNGTTYYSDAVKSFTTSAAATYNLSVEAGTGISAVTGSTNNISANQSIAITATVATGYTWSTWTKTGAGTLSTFTAGTKDQTVKVGAVGNMTLTASATENMSSLTTSNTYDAGNPSYAIPTKSASSIGISTTATLTATTPSTGYRFAGWTLSNNLVVTSGNAATDLSITVRTNGNGEAATAQANYNEVLTQNTWVLKGGSNITGDNWATEHALAKKTGHSTESVVYYTATISSTNAGNDESNAYSFKIIKKGDSDTWYGLGDKDCGNGEWWYNRATGEQTMNTGNKNIQIIADVAGNYEIKVDYSTPASPKVTVTFPTSYTLTYAIGDVNGTSGSISTSPTTASGSKVLEGNTVTLTAPTAKAGYTWKGWYTNAAGTTGKIDDVNRAISVTMNANKTFYACYTENNYTVTVNAGSHGSVASTSVTGHKDTKETLPTATPDLGYYFTGWTTTTGSVTYTNQSSASEAQVNGLTAAATVQANFAPIWALYSSINDWGDPVALGNYSTVSTKDYGYIEVDLEANTRYSFKIKDVRGTGTLYKPSTNTEITYANRATARTMNQTSGGDPNQTIMTAGVGTYRFTWNITDKEIKMTYPTSYTVTYYNKFRNVDGGISTATTGGSISAMSGSASGDQTSGKYFNNTETVTLTHTTANSGYTWIGWYNSEACSSAYSDGTNVDVDDANRTLALSNLAANTVVAALFEEVGTDITLANDGHGHVEINSATVTSTTVGKTTSRTIVAVPSTGYHFNAWTATSGTDYTIGSTSSASTSLTGKGSGASSQTVTASFTANSYSVRFNRNGGTGGDDMDNQAFTYDAAQELTKCSFSKTGYTFGGWATSQANADAGTKAYDDEEEVENLSSTNGATVDLFAIWTANNYTITLDVDETHKGSFDGATGSVTATFDATMPTIGGTLPTAASGYRYMGMYTAADGGGVALTDSLNVWKENVDDYISGGKWIRDDGDVTLYAYYKQARITSLVLSPSTQAPGEEVTATPTISPTPDGTTIICWRLLRANGNEMPGVEFDEGEGNSVSFEAPSASGSYKVACILRTGGACNAGTRLDSVVADLTVAGEHTVTIRYQDSDGRTLAPSTTITGKPLEWSSDAIEPITITGYSFARWDAGDGISITDDGGSTTKTTTTTASIKVKATYEGTLTAVYNKKDILYFNNTLGWDTVYVYFYSSDKYWDNDKGTGAKYDKEISSTQAHYYHFWGGMTKLGSSNVYYFDYEDSISNSSWDSEIRGYKNVAFTNQPQGFGYGDDGEDADKIGDGFEFFYLTNVIRRGDYDHELPMYVPLTGVEPVGMNEVESKKTAFYYNEGYWMNYPENTGYTLHIYSGKTYNVSDQLQEIPFEFTADKTLPMQLTVELNANREYGFEIHRADGKAYGNNSKVMKNGDSGDSGSLWALTASQRTGLQTSVAGEYIFTLDFGNSSGYKYLIGVHYPVAESDYRIVYTDEVAWSQGWDHNSVGHEGWYHPSRTIEKKDGAKDIVSFYVSKANDANASMKFQYASAVDGEGVVTWSDVTEGTIGLTEIEESGVYNFYLSQADGAITVDSIRPYTGNYYIRTANAGSSGWDNYRAADHRLTYTDFSGSRTTNTFGELYTHYYMHWCERNSDIRFVIANDYSSCISDTLVSDITDLGNLQSGANAGHLRTDFSADPVDDKFSANIRFMYNESTNKISRAYMSSSTNAARKFLVLRSNTKYSANGKALNGSGEANDDVNHIYEAIFEDDQDWIYERTVKVKPGSKFKLYASYAQETVQEDGSQHFRGAYDENDWTKSANYVELIGGSGDSCVVRVVYDFKTNRLMSAYVPKEGDIDGTLAINADIMLVRDHQEAGQQLTFANEESKLTSVKTVYGVMRFNRWILNNRQHPEDHDKAHSVPATINTYHPLINVLGDLKSSSERGLYWISFPFDVRLSEVFGFGTYGTDWVFLGYNGADRAKEGYWIDSDSFWEYIWDRQDTVLKAGHGIVLALDLDRMGATNTSFWKNEIQQVELFFPSLSSTTGTIMQTNAEVTLDAYECTIDRRSQAEKDANVQDITKNRTVVDSHWNILGVPSYANYDGTLKHLYKDGEGVDRDSVIVWNDEPETDDLPFLYEWNANDNTYTVRSGNSYAFKAMHAYYVQFAGKIRWTLASATPLSIVARRTYAERPQRVEFRLELQQNNKMVDHTYVKLRDDEEVSANFVFGEDLTKSLHQNKANIYTIVEDYLPVAGNTLPMSEQTMLIPVGVMPATEGEYTFSMPDGTDGIGVFLIDNVAHTRTNLGLTDYTVTLTAGKTNDRFMLEISPIAQTPTEIETVTGDGLQVTGARKVMIDGLLYIVKDGKVYDAQGKRVQ